MLQSSLPYAGDPFEYCWFNYVHRFSFFFWSRGHHKVEEACEMYCRAANMFKMAKNWSGAARSPRIMFHYFPHSWWLVGYRLCANAAGAKIEGRKLPWCSNGASFLSFEAAGNAFCKAARLHMQLQNKHDCATSFIDAGNAFKKSDPNGESAWQPRYIRI